MRPTTGADSEIIAEAGEMHHKRGCMLTGGGVAVSSTTIAGAAITAGAGTMSSIIGASAAVTATKMATVHRASVEVPSHFVPHTTYPPASPVHSRCDAHIMQMFTPRMQK